MVSSEGCEGFQFWGSTLEVTRGCSFVGSWGHHGGQLRGRLQGDVLGGHRGLQLWRVMGASSGGSQGINSVSVERLQLWGGVQFWGGHRKSALGVTEGSA